MTNNLNIIEVPEANDMPLDRWTAYMDCVAISNDLRLGEYCLSKENGTSLIKITKDELKSLKL